MKDSFQEEESKETEMVLYNELSVLADDGFVKAALSQLCAKIDKLSRK